MESSLSIECHKEGTWYMKNIAKRIIGKCCHIFHISIARFFNVRGMVFMLHWVGDEVQDKETEHFRVSTEQFKQLRKQSN